MGDRFSLFPLCGHYDTARVACETVPHYSVKSGLLALLQWPITLGLTFFYAFCRAALWGPSGNAWEFYFFGLIVFTGLTAVAIKQVARAVKLRSIGVPVLVGSAALWLVFLEPNPGVGTRFPAGFILIVVCTANAAWCGAVLGEVGDRNL